MSKKLVEEQDFKLEKLTKPIKVKNVDGSDNRREYHKLHSANNSTNTCSTHTV